MQRKSARSVRDNESLAPQYVRKVVLSLFTKNHDYAGCTAEDLLPELADFGITTRKGFRLLMKRHPRALLVDENQRLRRAETLGLREDFGPGGVDVHRNISRFAISGLVREALEKEFGWDAVLEAAERRGRT
ncbi:hypothetical protein [Aeromonas taiwanensis]|uniref:hypothetical protein n=1 Tax=Aeromonas taiwanensis TaxID=633417 RepID=UPI00248E83D3|nr:hypothetical protein [Aeromonas taiwanensis]